jgi:hypothetical protein
MANPYDLSSRPSKEQRARLGGEARIATLEARLAAAEAAQQRAINLAGDFIGTAPEYRNASCIEVAFRHAEELRGELDVERAARREAKE